MAHMLPGPRVDGSGWMVGRLLLWDVDGTLIRGGGVGSAAIREAAAVALGKPIDGPPVVMHGKTDPQILAELFVAADIADEDIPRLVPIAVAEAERLMALAEADLRARGEVIPGVVDVLARLATISGRASDLGDRQPDRQCCGQARGI